MCIVGTCCTVTVGLIRVPFGSRDLVDNLPDNMHSLLALAMAALTPASGR